jgi:hypothetical protein
MVHPAILLGVEGLIGGPVAVVVPVVAQFSFRKAADVVLHPLAVDAIVDAQDALSHVRGAVHDGSVFAQAIAVRGVVGQCVAIIVQVVAEHDGFEWLVTGVRAALGWRGRTADLLSSVILVVLVGAVLPEIVKSVYCGALFPGAFTDADVDAAGGSFLGFELVG